MTQALADEIERLRGLIETHNTECQALCGAEDREAWRCQSYVHRCRRCPDCPAIWKIDFT
jgi:hypothetical protein